jgi:hypothetical protein
MNQVEAYVHAKRIARGWIARNDAPPGIERECTRVITSAILKHGLDEMETSTLDLICREQFKKYVNRELDRQPRGAA